MNPPTAPSPSSHPSPRPRDRAEFNQLVFALVRRIPEGKVMTYGDVASCIPRPRGLDPLAYRRIRARWVGYALAACPEDVPWQRVVNADGHASPRPSGSHLSQLDLLAAEGVPLRRANQVDLARARWSPQ